MIRAVARSENPGGLATLVGENVPPPAGVVIVDLALLLGPGEGETGVGKSGMGETGDCEKA